MRNNVEMLRLGARFRPTVDRDTLWGIARTAWERHRAEIGRGTETQELQEGVTTHLEALYPPSDMKVLARYGYAAAEKTITVHIYCPVGGRANRKYGSWDWRCTVSLTRFVLLPASAGVDLRTPADWYFEPNLGIHKPLEYDRWEEHKIKTAQEIKRSVPRQFVPAFQRLAEGLDALKSEHTRLGFWPAELKRLRGEYPTWEEICAEFPIVGNHLRSAIAESGE